MEKNRLQLDFGLESSIERNNFIKQYLNNDIFKQKPPTLKELETISNYILFGKEEDGKSAVQKKEISIETKNKTWTKERDNVESIEELLENPAFDENIFVPIGEVNIKKKKEIFSREDALKEAPEEMKSVFLHLFKQIDNTDLLINYYELLHGKRKNQPREQLLNRFTEEEKQNLMKTAENLSGYNYLKLRHYLVELRSTQFTLKDSYTTKITLDTKYHLKPMDVRFNFDGDLPIFPFGVKTKKTVSELIFIKESDLENAHYTEIELKKISDFFWEQDNIWRKNPKIYFNFANPEHLYILLSQLPDLMASIEEEGGLIKEFLDTFYYYVDLAELSDIYKDLLNMKISQKKNLEIANFLNEKYNKSYTENYISTLFKQKIIKQIAKAAEFHKDLIENIYFSENFRHCTTCGRYLLKHPKNFVRKTRAKDGYCGRCKECDKVVRQKKKEK